MSRGVGGGGPTRSDERVEVGVVRRGVGGDRVVEAGGGKGGGGGASNQGHLLPVAVFAVWWRT